MVCALLKEPFTGTVRVTQLCALILYLPLTSHFSLLVPSSRYEILMLSWYGAVRRLFQQGEGLQSVFCGRYLPAVNEHSASVPLSRSLHGAAPLCSTCSCRSAYSSHLDCFFASIFVHLRNLQELPTWRKERGKVSKANKQGRTRHL